MCSKVFFVFLLRGGRTFAQGGSKKIFLKPATLTILGPYKQGKAREREGEKEREREREREREAETDREREREREDASCSLSVS